MNILRFLILPSDISDFERQYLARVNRVALAFFAVHVPVIVPSRGESHRPAPRGCAHVRRGRRPCARAGVAVESARRLHRPRHRGDVHGRAARAFRSRADADRDALLLFRAHRDVRGLRQPDGDHRRRRHGRASPLDRVARASAKRLQLRRVGLGRRRPRCVRRARIDRRVLHLTQLLRQRHRSREDRSRLATVALDVKNREMRLCCSTTWNKAF